MTGYRFSLRLTIFALLLLLGSTVAFSQTVMRDNSPIKKDKEYYVTEGMRFFNLKENDRAKEAFLKVIELDPENDAAYYYLSNISLDSNDIVSGEMLLQKAIEIDSTNYWYQSLMARICLSTNRAKEAIAIYEKLIGQYPKKTEIYYNLANLYVAEEDIDKSREVLDKIEKIGGVTESIVMAKFNLFRMSHDMEGALNYLQRANRELGSPRVEAVIGDLYTDRYNDSLAIVHYNKALELEPGYAPAIYGVVEIHRRKGNYKEFFSTITPLIANPQVVPLTKSEYLGQLLQLQHFVQKNRFQLDTLMDTFVATHPADTSAGYLASAYFAQTGEENKANAILKDMAERYPESPTIRTQYLSYLYYREDWESLAKEAEKSLAKEPDNKDFIQLLGIAQFQSDRNSEAIGTYRKLEEIALRDKDTANLLTAYSVIGDLSHETGNNKQAYAYYKKALKVNPGYNPVLNNYAYFLALENKSLKQAYNMSLKTIESEPDNPTYLDTFAWILFLMEKPVEAKTHLKHAMLYGGKESAAILDHYAEVLYALKEYDLAFIYWDQADAKDPSLGIKEKSAARKRKLKAKSTK